MKRFLLGWLVFTLVAFVLWTWGALSYTYAAGDRGGVVQKFSRKGWICKTYEGELAMYVVAGITPEIWTFSVRDPKVAEQLKGYVGERVQLHYEEHRGVPTSCFGETSYYVDGVTPVASLAPPPAALAPPTPSAPVPAP